MKKFACALCATFVLCSCFCSGKGTGGADASGDAQRTFAAPASIPQGLIEKINANRAAFIADLDAVLARDAEVASVAADPAGSVHGGLLLLIDKKRAIGAEWVPSALVAVAGGRSYVAGREGLSLRKPAEAALERMARAAKADGITLVVSSTYRSYDYQKKVYERNVREMGEQAASRESAKPGESQHQLGTAVDFGSITDEYAATRAGKWLASHAGEYGWSLSFPKGMEAVTGYRWECWHYRFIGVEAVALQDAWFGGSQQYMLEFIDAWRRWKSSGN